MLEKFKKFFGEAPAVEATQEVVQDVVEAVVEQVQVQLSVDTSEVQLALDELTAKFAALTEQFAELSGKYEEAQAALSAIEAEKAALVAEAAAVKAAARKEQVVAAIGTARADAVLAATDGLDDERFAAVLSAMAGSAEDESKSAMFKEVGVTAEVDAVKAVEAGGESEEMKLIRARYAAK